MAIGYRSNITALKIGRQANDTSARLGSVNIQLSSGLRINKASDDAGGLAVSMKLSASSRIQNRARLNIEDGISSVTSAESVMGTASEILQRLSELATQASSTSISSSQRAALSKEFNALRDEIGRLQDVSKFNGIQVNRGSAVARSEEQLTTSYTANGSAVSGDGRYIFYSDGAKLQQKDVVTGQITTLVSANVGSISTSVAGDRIAFINQTTSEAQVYDRLTGTTTTLFSTLRGGGAVFSALRISGDGSTVVAMSDQALAADGSFLGLVDGYDHFASQNLATGVVRGDDGVFGFSGADSSYLAVSYDGSQTAVLAVEKNIYNITEGFVFQTNQLETLSYYTNTGEAISIGDGIGITNSGVLYFCSGGNIGGNNSSLKPNIFSTSDGTTFTNVTNITTATGASMFRLTDAGTSIVYLSNSTTLGANPSGNYQAYKLDLATGSNRQLTNYTTTKLTGGFDAISDDGYTFTTNISSKLQSIDMSPELAIGFETGTGTAGVIQVGIASLDRAIRGLKSTSIATQREALANIDVLKNQLSSLESARGTVGSSISRLGVASRLSGALADRTNEAFHRIVDVDVATAVAESTRLQILGDGQMAILAQASKLSPQIALQLLP